MSHPEPLPFRVPLPGHDRLDFEGARSISRWMDGLARLEDSTLILRWATTQRIQEFSLGDVRDEVEAFPAETLEVPIDWMVEARLEGGWWLPRLELRARRLEAFYGLPNARPGAVTLRFRRRHRAIATAFAAAINRRTGRLDG